MVFDEKKYTEDSIIKQLTLIQLHSTDGSALDAGCSCIEGKHLHALEGLAEEAIMTASSPQEKVHYENLANFAREERHAIEEQRWSYMPHNPGMLGRVYHPHGLTECEKTHPRILRKISRCIRKVEKREGCTPPYIDCLVNPVAVCRASIKCP